MSKDNQTEITITHIFKSNDMIAESDILFRFEVRELMRRAKGIPPLLQAEILRNEADLLLAVNEDPSQAMQEVDKRPY